MSRFLAVCRYLLVVPVLGCVFLTAGAFVMGLGRIVVSLGAHLSEPDFSKTASKKMALSIIEIIDLFLVGTVAYIAAVGLYKLFIAKVDVQLPVRLKIRNLADLENKIIGVIVAALAVAFLGQAAGPSGPEKLLRYGAGIAFVIASLAYFIDRTSKSAKVEDDTVGE
jgi:uncharacterized membrane protein YqhA